LLDGGQDVVGHRRCPVGVPAASVSREQGRRLGDRQIGLPYPYGGRREEMELHTLGGGSGTRFQQILVSGVTRQGVRARIQKQSPHHDPYRTRLQPVQVVSGPGSSPDQGGGVAVIQQGYTPINCKRGGRTALIRVTATVAGTGLGL